MADIRVTAETRHNETGMWECAAWAADAVSVEAATEDEAKALFVDTWNATQGTSYTVEEFAFVRQQ